MRGDAMGVGPDAVEAELKCALASAASPALANSLRRYFPESTQTLLGVSNTEVSSWLESPSPSTAA